MAKKAQKLEKPLVITVASLDGKIPVTAKGQALLIRLPVHLNDNRARSALRDRAFALGVASVSFESV